MEEKFYQNWHLAKSEMEFNTTQFEWTLIRFHEAFSRYIMTTGMLTVASELDIKYPEHIILHVIRMLDRPKNSTTIAHLLNRDDIPNIQYSLRKLESAGLIEKIKDRASKNYLYIMTEKGVRLTDEYYKLRGEVLMKQLNDISGISEKLDGITRFLSLLIGIYEEAARNSATLSFPPES